MHAHERKQKRERDPTSIQTWICRSKSSVDSLILYKYQVSKPIKAWGGFGRGLLYELSGPLTSIQSPKQTRTKMSINLSSELCWLSHLRILCANKSVNNAVALHPVAPVTSQEPVCWLLTLLFDKTQHTKDHQSSPYTHLYSCLCVCLCAQSYYFFF